MSWKGFDSKWLASTNMTILKCAQCGVEFAAYPSRSRKFCSPECAYSNQERITRIANLQRKKRGSKICPGCGNEFQLRTGGGTTYCSQSCAAAHVGKRTMAANRKVSPRTKFVKTTCPTCGKEFEYWSSSKRIYCSSSCSGNNPDRVTKIVISRRSKVQENCYSRCRRGWVELGTRRFYAKSRWEANYGRYLEWLRSNGQIADWEYEPETFWFHGIKRGVLSYLPDFRVVSNDGRVVFHEVKGWMDPKSKTRLRRMTKYHPSTSVLVLDSQWFKNNSKMMAAVVPGWE